MGISFDGCDVEDDAVRPHGRVGIRGSGVGAILRVRLTESGIKNKENEGTLDGNYNATYSRDKYREGAKRLSLHDLRYHFCCHETNLLRRTDTETGTCTETRERERGKEGGRKRESEGMRE
eukprot:751727-Hanusia_phi.AAC.13